MMYSYECKKCNKKEDVEMSLEEHRKSTPPVCCGEEMGRVWGEMHWQPCKGMHSYGYRTLDGKRGVR